MRVDGRGKMPGEMYVTHPVCGAMHIKLKTIKYTAELCTAEMFA